MKISVTKTGRTFNAFPVWSPNGRQIAFTRVVVSSRGGPKPPYVSKSEIWVLNVDGSDQGRLASGWPSAWSPNGQSRS